MTFHTPGGATSRTHLSRPAALITALMLIVVACSASGSSSKGATGPQSEGLLDTAAAATAAQDAIDQGDDLGECPFGTPEQLVAAFPEEIQVSPDLDEDSAEASVLSGRTLDAVLCFVSDTGAVDAEIGSLTIEVVPRGAIDLDTFLGESGHYTRGLTEIDGFLDKGDAHVGCGPSGHCRLMWQSPELLVSVMVKSEIGPSTDDVTAVAEALIPVVIANLNGTSPPVSETATTQPAPGLDTASAAVAAQAAIDQGEPLGPCPLGTPAALVDALPDEIQAAPGLAEDLDNGQVLKGGAIDKTYCILGDPSATGTDLGGLTVEVSPDSDTEFDTYFDLFGIDERELSPVDGFLDGGEAQVGCRIESPPGPCMLMWRDANVFVTVKVSSETGVDAEDVTVAAEALVPLAISNLAG